MKKRRRTVVGAGLFIRWSIDLKADFSFAGVSIPASDAALKSFDHHPSLASVRFASDCVAKLFCPSERVRLIQDQASIRNVDSRIHSLGFDCCVFLFYTVSTETFATQSLPKRSYAIAPRYVRLVPILLQKSPKKKAAVGAEL
jgi:hypothetical protein